MEKKVVLNIPLGYIITEKVKRVSVCEAERILTSKKQRNYTKAVKNGADAELFGNYMVCPHCNREFVANMRKNMFGPRWYVAEEHIADEHIHKWADRQLSLFEEEKPRTLHISPSIKRFPSFKCPECDITSEYSEKSRRVEVSLRDTEIHIKSEILSIKEILAIQWTRTEMIPVSFPMYESVVFDLGEGRVYVSLENKENLTVCEGDITNEPRLCGTVFNLINYNKVVRRTIKRLFEKAWGKKLPYCDKEINVRNLFKMTMFIGYDKQFYTDIPYTLNSFTVDSTFAGIAKQLHNAENIAEVYANSGLPQVKSVRKLFYENAGLFFYLPEAEKIFLVLKDINLFCRFLQYPVVFDVLSDLHMRPGLMVYIEDACSIKGEKAVLKEIESRWDCMLEAAMDYCCASPVIREAMKKEWTSKRKNPGVSFQRRPFYSIPMHRPEERIHDCNINGFYFFWLRNSNEYALAGKELKNCLGMWRTGQNPVVCVKKKDKYVAAIEVSGREVMQVRGIENADIQKDSKLQEALEKWMESYKLRRKKYLVFDDDEFLPGLD